MAWVTTSSAAGVLRRAALPSRPNQLPRYTRRDGALIHVFYALSTWNPYQVVLMRHAISEWDRSWLIGGCSFTSRIVDVVSRLTAERLTAHGAAICSPF